MTRGRQLRELRTRNGLSMSQVAAHKDCDVSYLSLIERDLRPCRRELFDEFQAAIHRAVEHGRKLSVDAALSELRCVLDHVVSVVEENFGRPVA